MNTLHLTSPEKKRFQSLSPTLQEGWTIVDETGSSYESDRALKIRTNMSRLGDIPEMRALMRVARAGGPIDRLVMTEIPDEYLSDFFFTIGARGVAAMVDQFLSTAKTDEDIRNLAALTVVRHELLANNAAISYAA